MRGIHAPVWSLQSRGGGGEPIHRQGLNQQRAEGPGAPLHRSLFQVGKQVLSSPPPRAGPGPRCPRAAPRAAAAGGVR